MTLTATPFDDLKALLNQLPDADSCAARKVGEALECKGLDKADGLVKRAIWLAQWQGKAEPSVAESHICILASSYEGQGDSVSVTDYIEATSKGAAPVNLLCVDKGIGLRAIQLAPEMPHRVGLDWTEADCMAAVAFGMEATAAGGDLLALTDMAPGNDANVLAILLACTDLDDASLELIRKDADLWRRTMDIMGGLKPKAIDSLTALRLYGGREIAAAIGALVAARSRRLPVMAEGWAALAACYIADSLASGAADHVSAVVAEGEQEALLWRLLKKDQLIGQPVGGGAGCALAMGVSMMAASCALLGLRDQK